MTKLAAPLKVYYNSDSSASPGTLFSNFDSSLSMESLTGSSSADFDSNLYTKRSTANLCGYWLKTTAANAYSYIALLNTLAPDSGPIFVNQMNQAIIRTVTG
jgi:hypothetical protein